MIRSKHGLGRKASKLNLEDRSLEDDSFSITSSEGGKTKNKEALNKMKKQ